MSESNIKDIDKDAFKEYEKEVQKLALIIKEDIEQQDRGPMNGREWCEKHDIPENAFADAIDWNYQWFDYGVSPMCPWSTSDYE